MGVIKCSTIGSEEVVNRYDYKLVQVMNTFNAASDREDMSEAEKTEIATWKGICKCIVIGSWE